MTPKIDREKQLQKALIDIPRTTTFGDRLLQRALNNGWLSNVAAQAGWVSSSNVSQNRIRIGVDPLPDGVRDRITFGRRSQEELLRHRILHELGHFVIGLGYVGDSHSVELLTQYTQAIRAETGGTHGLTGIGSLPFYATRDHGDSVASIEDATDLLAEYVNSPEILAGHLSYLSNPRISHEHQELGLYTLNATNAGKIYDAVEDVVNKHVK